MVCSPILTRTVARFCQRSETFQPVSRYCSFGLFRIGHLLQDAPRSTLFISRCVSAHGGFKQIFDDLLRSWIFEDPQSSLLSLNSSGVTSFSHSFWNSHKFCTDASPFHESVIVIMCFKAFVETIFLQNSVSVFKRGERVRVSFFQLVEPLSRQSIDAPKCVLGYTPHNFLSFGVSKLRHRLDKRAAHSHPLVKIVLNGPYLARFRTFYTWGMSKLFDRIDKHPSD